MKKSLFLISFLLIITYSQAQDYSFKAGVNTDSLLMGNYLEVKFKLSNVRGSNFSAPDFEGFQLVGGPNQSSMSSFVNGEMSSSLSYTYYLNPIEPGNYYIAPASIETEHGILETEPLEIIVMPNPDGIQQKVQPEEERWELFSPPVQVVPPKPRKPRKKRRIYQI